MTQRDVLMRDLHRAGLRLDDAALAASMAVRRMLDLRNRLMRRARDIGMSEREIAGMFGVSQSLAHRVVSDEGAPAEVEPLEETQPSAETLVARLDALLVQFRPITS
jgi:predicted transcriptional regulator